MFKSILQITLQIGTEIKFTVVPYSKFISEISIKPSIYDIDAARGLCGVPSVTKDNSDDFTHRDLGPISDEKSFADSWRYIEFFRQPISFVVLFFTSVYQVYLCLFISLAWYDMYFLIEG